MKKSFKLNKRKLALSLLAALTWGGVTSANADEITVYDGTATNDYLPMYGYYADSKGTISEFIIPSSELSALNGETIEQMTFYLSTPATDSWGSASFNVYLEEVTGSNYDDSSASQLTDNKTLVYAGALDGTGTTMEIPFTTSYSYNGGNLLIAIEVGTNGTYKKATFYGTTTTSNAGRYKYSSTTNRAKFIPKTTFVTLTDGPALSVKDGSTKLTSPCSYNFGLATAGTTHTFTLSNPGTENLDVAVSETGNFGATLSATTIAAGGEVTLTVTMPETSGSSAVTITPSAEGIAPFVINVSGTIRNPAKVYLDFADGKMPDGWTSVKVGSWASDWTVGTGYIGQSNSQSYETTNYDAAFTSPKLVFEANEQILFESSRYNNNTNATYVKVQYSTDGTTWTDCSSNFEDNVYGTWTQRSATIPTADAQYIRFYGKNVYLRNLYGGELPVEPKMEVTRPESLNFGNITVDATKTFTIANTGLATLTGISVTSDNAAFSISNIPTTLDAKTNQEVTITMSAATAGNLSATITVSADNMEDVKFVVNGTVLPSGLSVIDFNDNQLPARWQNTGWTFSDGAAYAAYHSPAYVMTTPNIAVEENDLFVIKAKLRYSGNSYYVTINGSSDNGTTWTAYTKTLSSELNTDDYATILITDIPATVNKLQFVGYYGFIDEIQGINYAPELSVTDSEDVAQISGLTYDFGECAADATVTYNFANTGAGTIDITKVEISGDGAASYSTGWTESVAAPYSLVITRTYDADKAGTAQEAVVTVTTTEGDFVINVTGTDKAANAPELVVSTNAIDFGKVMADAQETVTVTNNGTGLLEVNIASDSEDFIVSAATLDNIGAGESKTFTVTFKYGTPYGVKSGNITVTPTYDNDAAETITLTGKAKDPDMWSEDFAASELPTGWEAGANWTVADGVAKGAYVYGSTSYLTTPTLTVSDATDELTFDYNATSNYVSVKIQMSKDGAAFADYKTISSLNNGDNGQYTITGLEAGDYQFRFANDDYELDNFEGFKLNLADHIASISAYTIPESSSYSVTMKEGRSFDATVTVKESRGVEEALTAKLYMGDDVIGTATGTVAANGTETLTITATPVEAASNGAQMHIEVEYAGGTLKTEEVTRYVDALIYLTLDETSSDAITAGTYDEVTLKRQFIAGWNTVCLPFTISDVEGFFGTGAKAYNFSSYTDGELGFTKVDELSGSYPYLVYVPAAITEDIALKDITIASSDRDAFYRSQSNCYFRGTYAPMAAGTLEGKYILTTNNKIQPASDKATLKGFRGYFEAPANARLSIVLDGEASGIVTIVNGELQMENAYNLQGQKVMKTGKGLYIVNGQKVVRK